MAPTNDSLDMGPLSPIPDIRKMKHAAAVEAMVEWFFSNFEDPAHPHTVGWRLCLYLGRPLLRAGRA